MTPADIALLGAGGFVAGAINAVAGGGTFFSFPALLAAGLPPVVANASNSVALWPGSLAGAWAYRRELAAYKRYLLPMGAASLLGGIVGGLLLLAAGDARFSALIPWLLAFATALFAFSPQISAALKRRRPARPVRADGGYGSGTPAGWLVQLLVSVYGGFFGAGMGILTMASLAMGGHEDVQHINALKNLLSAINYSVTALTFIVAGAVSWPQTLVMLLAASAGGYAGARVARRIRGPWLRRMVIAVGAALTLYYFYKG
ncbi:MAG: sulfite exporter TauE/SafE family protein [Polaromonas sp.]|nr:sulfite exporter TauE/SafE family protein [Polaromonas sp.]